MAVADLLAQHGRVAGPAGRPGDAEAAANLRGRLAAHPELLDGVAGLAARAEAAWVARAAGGDELAATVIRTEVAELTAELLGSAATAVERVVAGSVVVSFLAERHAAQRAAEPADSPQVAALRLRRAESGQRRLLAAV